MSNEIEDGELNSDTEQETTNTNPYEDEDVIFFENNPLF